MIFNCQEVEDTLPMLLEHISDQDSLQAYYERNGINREDLYDLARELKPLMHSFEATFVMGFLLAWETARRQKVIQ